jgi:hypothetical protein
MSTHRALTFEGNENLASFGQFGIRVLTGNAIADETFIAIQSIEDCVISADLVSLDAPDGPIIGDSSITSLALTAGTIIYGRFVALEVASGKVIAYKG